MSSRIIFSRKLSCLVSLASLAGHALQCIQIATSLLRSDPVKKTHRIFLKAISSSYSFLSHFTSSKAQRNRHSTDEIL